MAERRIMIMIIETHEIERSGESKWGMILRAVLGEQYQVVYKAEHKFLQLLTRTMAGKYTKRRRQHAGRRDSLRFRSSLPRHHGDVVKSKDLGLGTSLSCFFDPMTLNISS